MKREDLIAATRAYLADWADEGHSIIPWRHLVKYGFDPVWLRDLVEDIPSGEGKRAIYDVATGAPLKRCEGIYTLGLLEELCQELGVSHIGASMGRGTCARILTRRIQVALGDADPPENELSL